MLIDDDEIKELGATATNGRPFKAAPPAPMAALLGALRQMTSAIETAAARKIEVKAPAVKVEAPTINVAAPNVTVEAAEPVPAATEWEAEITERDEHGRLKKFRIRTTA